MADDGAFDYKRQGDSVTNVSRPDIEGSNLGRVLPRQNSSGFTRGTQPIGQGGSAIDGSNNRIIIQSTDGSTNGMGNIPSSNNQYGFFQLDPSGKIIMEIIDGTTYTYNKNDQYRNSEINGFAPNDGRPGIWFAKPGKDATELLNG